jgi:ABC-type Mn2+/Zn2+ transport system permease subunit
MNDSLFLCASASLRFKEYSIMPNALTASIFLSIACAALSVFVVSRRWAFIGEGISHSGFGGAGTAWMLTLLFPSLAFPALPQICVILFCILTGLAIGYLSNRRRTNADAAIGIFMVASLAWGFLSAELYRSVKHQDPVGFSDFLFGQMSSMTGNYALSVILLSCAVIVVLFAFGKEILYCSFDADMARASGVPADLIHYILMLLVTLTIVLGIRIAGSVLVTALLVLPGATAALVSQRLRTVFIIAITTAILGTSVGVLSHLHYKMLPAGPAIVLSMFAEFLICLLIARIGTRSE